MPMKNDGPAQVRPHQIVNGDRTAQLEQNMKFLQDQHQATLVALHQEVETLRQRNRGNGDRWQIALRRIQKWQ